MRTIYSCELLKDSPRKIHGEIDSLRDRNSSSAHYDCERMFQNEAISIKRSLLMLTRKIANSNSSVRKFYMLSFLKIKNFQRNFNSKNVGCPLETSTCKP